MLNKRVFVIALTNDWAEVRVSDTPPKRRISSFTRFVDVPYRNIIPDPLGRLDYFGNIAQVWDIGYKKQLKTFSQVNYRGGKVVCQVAVREYNRNAMAGKFPRLTTLAPLVELTGKQAENFSDPTWVENNIASYLPGAPVADDEPYEPEPDYDEDYDDE